MRSTPRFSTAKTGKARWWTRTGRPRSALNCEIGGASLLYGRSGDYIVRTAPAATPFQRGSPVTYPMILAPLFVLVLMTFAIGILLATLRGPALMRGEVRAEDVSLRQPNWSPRTLQV